MMEVSLTGSVIWISTEYDEIEEDKKVRLDMTRLKGHASLWWDSVQAERRRKNNPFIKKMG